MCCGGGGGQNASKNKEQNGPEKKQCVSAFYQAYAQNKPGALKAIFLKPHT